MSALPVWLAFGLGLVIGAWFTWEYFLRREKPVIKLEVTREVLDRLDEQTVLKYLDMRGLCWMPKGTDFKAKVKL